MKHLSSPLSLSTESHTPYQSTFTGFMMFMKLENRRFNNHDRRCKHGNAFSSEDPIFSGWVASSEVIVYRYSVTITSATRKLYYRPAQRGCNCGSFYDGQDDLLFNLDNRHLFTCGLHFQYLHLTIEGKNPLAAFHRFAGRCHGVLGTTQPPTTLKILCSAWNAFTRLLDLKFSGNFQCPVCGCLPETIICDGTLVGFPALLQEPDRESLPITDESNHSDRVFLCSVKRCELLMNYSGYSKDRKRLPSPKPLTRSKL